MPSVARFRERITTAPPGNRIDIGVIKEIYDLPLAKKGTVRQTLPTVKSTTSSTSTLFERCYDETHGSPPYLVGGPFFSVKAHLPHHSVQANGLYIGSPPRQLTGTDWTHYEYSGGFGDPNYAGITDLDITDYVNAGLNFSNTSLYPSLASLGAAAYAKLRPQLEKAGLGVALAEARDLPRMMRTTSRMFHDTWSAMGGRRTPVEMQPKKLADDFLNVQFGWIPFLTDLHKFYDVFVNSGKYIAQLRRDNNRWVKRLRTDKVIVSETLLSTNPGMRLKPSHLGIEMQDLFSANPTSWLGIRDSTYVWYEGVFKYYRPEFDGSLAWTESMLGDMYRFSTVLGARINPSVIYRATPWTWLADWFTNVGDTVQRATDAAFDGVVSKYMYLMHHHVRELVLKQTVPLKSGGTRNLEFSRIFDIKRRENANSPYGFSLSPDLLTGRQISILAALGVARVT